MMQSYWRAEVGLVMQESEPCALVDLVRSLRPWLETAWPRQSDAYSVRNTSTTSPREARRAGR